MTDDTITVTARDGRPRYEFALTDQGWYETYEGRPRRYCTYQESALIDALLAARRSRDTLVTAGEACSAAILDLMTYPAAMAQIGPIAKGLAEGAAYRLRAAIDAAKEVPRE